MDPFDTGLGRIRHRGRFGGEFVFTGKKTTGTLCESGDWCYRQLCRSRSVRILLETATFSSDEPNWLCRCPPCVDHSADILSVPLSLPFALRTQAGKKGVTLLSTNTFCQIALLSGGKFLYPSPDFMGNFKQHITCSTVTGIAVGGIAYHFGISPSACLVSVGLCSFAGMLPDIDSDTSKSFQECIYLTAGIGCILTAARLRHHDFDPDLAMLGGAFMFLFIRFVVAAWIKKITTHRGMIHSIPMAILSGELAFFVVTGETVQERLIKAAALMIGYLSHLILDEVYSIDSTGATLRLKKSFGTALKWTNPKKKGAVTAIYAMILCFGYAICVSPDVMETINGVEVAKESPSDVEREAAEFLSQQGAASPAVPPYSVAATKPANAELPLFQREVPSELPPAMQIEDTWNRNAPIRPAPIVLR